LATYDVGGDTAVVGVERAVVCFSAS